MAILDALPVAVGLVKDRQVVWVNPAFTEQLGYSFEEALNQPLTTYFQDVPRYTDAMKEAVLVLANGGTYQADLLMRRKSGELFWGHAIGRCLVRGRPEGAVLWTLADVTERRETEESLLLSQARLEAAQAHALVGSWELGPDMAGRYWSTQMYTLFGFDPAEGLPTLEGFLERVHPDDRHALIEAHLRAVEGHQPHRMTYLCNTDPACPRYFETTIVPEYGEGGQLLRVTGTTQDVTERKRAADAARDSERRMQRLLENSNDLICLVDEGGHRRAIHGPVKTLLGYDPAEFEHPRTLTLVHPDDVPDIQRAIAENMAHPGVPYRVEVRLRHKDGGWVDIEAVGTNWFDDPLIRGIVVNLRRITERKQSERERERLQEQLQQAMKMDAIGRLAGGVAHDFNNLLTVISGNIQLALEDLAPQNPLTQRLSEVGKAASSAASLTRQLLAFSKRQLVEPKVVDLNPLIGNLRAMLGRLIGEDVALELRLSADPGTVRIDPGQLDQVLVNLAVNARDAMPGGGRLIIETANVDLDADYCREHGELSPGAYVRVTVSDDGEGMAPKVLHHIFEPFFTTKTQGSGTGLGLSVVFGIVKQSGGAIDVRSEPGVGTTFTIWLPLVDAQPRSLGGAASTGTLRGSETILLVEDNETVRDLTTRMLRRLGYRVLAAVDGERALALTEEGCPSIDLLLTDLIMPGMSGRELGDRIHERCPKLPILYCSGYTEDTIVRHGIESESVHFIAKPFTLQGLGQKVRLLLDEHRRATESHRTEGGSPPPAPKPAT